MKLVFNEKIGKIASIIHSLNYANNLDLLIDKLKSENIKRGMDVKEDLCLAKAKLKEKAEDLDFFFGKESMIWKAFIHTEKFWTCNNIQEFLNQVMNLSEIQIKERLYIKLNRGKDQKVNHAAENVIKNNKEFFYYIKVLKIEQQEKWRLLCFIEDVGLYTKKFVELVKFYIPIYDSLHDKYKNEELVLCDKMKKIIVNNQFEYIEDLTKSYVDIRDYEEVHVTVSVFNNYQLNFAIEGNIIYLYVGLRFEEIFKRYTSSEELEQHLLVFKNIAEKTRFEIIKFLLHGEHFGQEIAEKMQISTAAVSYQMNYLFSANLVTIRKVDRKTYYVLNKDTVRNGIEFLQKELGL